MKIFGMAIAIILMIFIITNCIIELRRIHLKYKEEMIKIDSEYQKFQKRIRKTKFLMRLRKNIFNRWKTKLTYWLKSYKRMSFAKSKKMQRKIDLLGQKYNCFCHVIEERIQRGHHG